MSHFQGFIHTPSRIRTGDLLRERVHHGGRMQLGSGFVPGRQLFSDPIGLVVKAISVCGASIALPFPRPG
jgi:hypothetical protein